MKRSRLILKLIPLAAACAAAPALATNGYFAHGYGMKAKGMGGAAAALAQDSMGGANNPASMVWAGSRMDLGLDIFRPIRSAERSGAGFPSLNGESDSGRETFFIPEFGYNRLSGKDLSLGVTVYGNGGMNTTYRENKDAFNCGAGPANMLCGSGKLGVDLSQLVVAPTLAWKPHAQHSIGASVLLGYQRFKAYGLQAFDNPPGFPPFTGNPGKVTNNGYDNSFGAGLRVGWQGHFSDMFSVGAAYSTQIKMSKFDKYRGLFANNGSFDIPSNYSVGVALTPVPEFTLAADFQRVMYSDIPAVNTPSLPVAPLGAKGGPGFGWGDVSVFKIGASWRANETLTLRGGYNRGQNPISAADVTFNILAPGVMKEHYTLGLTYALSSSSELTLAGMYAPTQRVSGSSLFNSPALFGPGAGGTETIKMNQHSFGITWGNKF